MSKKKIDHFSLLGRTLMKQADPTADKAAIEAHLAKHYGAANLEEFDNNGHEEDVKIEFYQSALTAITQRDWSVLATPPVVEVVAATPHIESVDSETGAWRPEIDPTHIVSPEHQQLFDLLDKMRKRRPQNVMVKGPTGCGKTALAIQFAARVKMPILIMNCATVREPRDWFGHRFATGGSTGWKTSKFDKALSAGGHVIALNEFNRTSPSVLNSLFDVLDDTLRSTFIEERGDVLNVGPGTVFVATINEGASYTGTAILDEAMQGRFTRTVEVNYLPEEDEIKVLRKRTRIKQSVAKKLVELANAIRAKHSGYGGTLNKTLSTRHLIAAAEDFMEIGPKALTYTIANHFSPDGGDASERFQVIEMLQGKGLLSETKEEEPAEAAKAAAV